LRAEETSGRKKSAIETKKQVLHEQWLNLRLPEVIISKFSINSAIITSHNLISISEGSIGYDGVLLIRKINLSLASKDRIVLIGNNGSGKSILIKAILGERGDSIWALVFAQNAGYWLS